MNHLILLTIIFFLTFNSTYAQNNKNKLLRCILDSGYTVDIVRPIKIFEKELLDFLSESYDYDIIFIKYPRFLDGPGNALMKRIIINNDSIQAFSNLNNFTSECTKILLKDFEQIKLNQLLNDFNIGNYLQYCEDYIRFQYIYEAKIKIKGKLVFEYFSWQVDYDFLSDNDRNKIDKTLELFDFIRSLHFKELKQGYD